MLCRKCRRTRYSIAMGLEYYSLHIFLPALQGCVRFSMPRSNDTKVCPLSMFYCIKESYFITSKRSELYGWVDFLANCGGLLGLFMGVSILSLLEICYFITIRPFSVRSRIASAEKRKSIEVQIAMLPVITKRE